MERTLDYEFPLDEEGFNTDSFEYEPDRGDVEEALKEVVKNDYDVPAGDDELEDFIEMNYEQLFNEYKDYLKNHFEDLAKEEYEDHKAYQKNPDAYYGVSRND